MNKVGGVADMVKLKGKVNVTATAWDCCGRQEKDVMC